MIGGMLKSAHFVLPEPAEFWRKPLVVGEFLMEPALHCCAGWAGALGSLLVTPPAFP